jgi:hypothetical protein
MGPKVVPQCQEICFLNFFKLYFLPLITSSTHNPFIQVHFISLLPPFQLRDFFVTPVENKQVNSRTRNKYKACYSKPRCGGVRVKADLLILWRASERWGRVDGGDGEDGEGYWIIWCLVWLVK